MSYWLQLKDYLIVCEFVRNFWVDVYFLVRHVVKFRIIIVRNDVKHVVFVTLGIDFDEVFTLYVLGGYYVMASVVCMFK